VTIERTSKKDKKKIQEERRRMCEKRNPLLDRVKSTRLTFFKDRDSDSENENDGNDKEVGQTQFHSMCELRHRNLIRNKFRCSVWESNLKKSIAEEKEKCNVKRKKRAKSQCRLPDDKNHQREQLFFLGFHTSTVRKSESLERKDIIQEYSIPHHYQWETNQDFFEEKRDFQHADTEMSKEADEAILKKNVQFDSVTPSSCLAAKFRAIQDRYLKSSTNKLIAKIYRKDCKDRDRQRLRSFSYGALPGLEELRMNPLFENQDQDDNDSGILDNDSATSSLLDDRCSSGASGILNNSHNDSCLESPPQLPPRRPLLSAMDVDKTVRLFNNLDMYDKIKNTCEKKIVREYLNVCQAANNTLIDYQTFPLFAENNANRENKEKVVLDSRQKCDSILQLVKGRTYIVETMVVKLPREASNQCLGIFIAKTTEPSSGYLVTHVVPNGLADKEGTLRIGDEILIVNGKRLRGLRMAEAKKILSNGNGSSDIDIVISRFSDIDQQTKKLKESSVDYENVSMEDGHGIIVENSSGLHFRKHQIRYRDKKDESNKSILSEKFAMNMDNSFRQNISKFCTLPRRPRSTISTFFTVLFEKGAGKKSLGFTIVGGRDSPKGSIGNYKYY